MSRKIYVKENNLVKIKNAMASENTSHSTFMSEDKPPYEKDEFTIDPEGGANDNFHIGENIETEVEANEVSLDSFKKRTCSKDLGW